MSEWIHSTVGAITNDQRAGGTPPVGVEEFYGGEIPFVTIEDITRSGRFLESTEKSLTEKGLANSAAWFIKEPHILYSMYATVGKPIINTIPCATNQAIIALKESDAIEQAFLFYQLLFIRPQVYKYTAQTTQSNLNAGTVRQLPISYPRSKAIQQKIARILTNIDITIEKTEALIEKYQQIKAGLMHDLFTRGIGADGKLRPPREQAPELYQQTPIGWIPKEWGYGMLDREIRIIDCKHVTPAYCDDGCPIIRPRNVNNDGLDFENVDYVSIYDFKKLTDIHAPRKGDIVYSRNASFGIPCYVETERKFAIGQDVVIMTKTVMDTRFVYYVLKSDLVWNQVSRLFAGSTFGRINLGDIRKFLIPKPSDHEQVEIATRLQIFDKKIEREIENKHKYQKVKYGLMHDLLTGKVSVQIAESEQEPT